MSKRFIVPLTAIALVLSLSLTALADTIRLKDGTVIRGQVVGFRDQQFTVLVGAGTRGRRSTLTLYMEDVESIEFDAATANTGYTTGDDDDPVATSTTQPSTQRPSSTTRPSTGGTTGSQPQPSTSRPSSGAPTTNNNPSTTTRPSTPASTQPNFFQINARVRGDNTSNGWTNSGLVVRRGQRLRVTAMGQVSLGNGRFSPPAGISTLQDRDKLMPDEPTGALIAVIGDDNNEFIFIGRTREFVAQRDGVLFLGINEGNLNDNTGAYDVVVEADAGTR